METSTRTCWPTQASPSQTCYIVEGSHSWSNLPPLRKILCSITFFFPDHSIWSIQVFCRPTTVITTLSTVPCPLTVHKGISWVYRKITSTHWHFWGSCLIVIRLTTYSYDSCYWHLLAFHNVCFMFWLPAMFLGLARCLWSESESQRVLIAMKVCTDKKFTLAERCIH